MSVLPLTARKEPGELLSSWLDRTAALHRVSRLHLLTWAGCSPRSLRAIDETLVDDDVRVIASMLRSSAEEVLASTHCWLGRLSTCLVRRRGREVECRRCLVELGRQHGAVVRMKHWREGWRILCERCGGVLTQQGEEDFDAELRWSWYAPVVRNAHRGSELVAAVVRGEHRLPAISTSSGEELSVRHGAPVLPGFVTSMFGSKLTSGPKGATLANLSFPCRIFVLAATGARSSAEAEWARHLLRVWEVNRKLGREADKRRRRKRGKSQSQ
jgi:hypothetical protein